MLDLSRRYFALCLAISIAVVVGFWVSFYVGYSTNGLPLGWDTPFYIWRINSVSSSGIFTFVVTSRYYDFLYPVAGSLISRVGLNSFQIESLVPLLLWIVASVVIFTIVRRESSDPIASVVATSAGPMWFALFRISSDLHANLLGLVLMLCGTGLFLQILAETRPRWLVAKTIGIGGIILLSSLAHIETTIFIASTWLLALLFSLWRGMASILRTVVIAAAITSSLVPGIIIFWFQQQWVAGLLQGRLPSIPPMSALTWILYVGPVGLCCLFLVPVMFYMKRLHVSSRFRVLTLSWLLLSIGVGLAQYFYQAITPFSERAIILAPTPFLAAILIPEIGKLRRMSQLKGVALITIIILGGSAIYYIDVGHRFYNSFISSSAADSLEFIKSSQVINITNSIFLFSDPPDQLGAADHSNFWVGAYLGDHFAYLGRVDFLMAGMETPFNADQSTQISKLFLNGLPISQIRNMTIVYITDFNYPDPMPTYYSSFLKPIGHGVYEVDRAIWNVSQVIIPAYSSVLSSSGSWKAVNQPWARSGSSLVLNATNPRDIATASIAFPAAQTANYTIILRLAEGGPSNPISVTLDGNAVYQIQYSNADTVTNATVFTGYLARGNHIISLSVGDNPSLPQFVNLDYVSIQQ